MADDQIGEAKRLLVGLKQAHDDQGAKLAQNEQAIRDVKDIVRTLSEEINRAQSRPLDASDRDVGDRYVRTAPDGSKTVQMQGEYDHRAGVYRAGLLDDAGISNPWVNDLRRAAHRRTLVRILAKPTRNTDHYAPSTQCDEEINGLLRNAPAGLQRIFADSSGIGAEWIPDVTLPMLDQDLRAARRVEALFPTMPMSDKTIVLPRMTVGLRPYIKGSATSDDPGQYTASDLTTSSNTYTATSFAVRLQVDDDASEDSILAMEPIINAELVAAGVDGFEDGILNGDTAGTHQDTGIASWNIRNRWGASGLGTSADHRRAFIGLRARAADVSNTSDKSGAQTYAGILSLRASLDSPMGLNDCVLITSPEWYLSKLLGLTEVTTLDKFGPNATILSGQIAAIGGMPVIISEFMDKELNASGVYDNSVKSYTGALIVNRSRFFVGQRRGAVVEVDRDITRGLRHWVVTYRKTFNTFDAASKKNVAYGYKLSVS